MTKRYQAKTQKQRHTVRANKHLGQHFLTDSAMIARIVEAIAPGIGDNLLEIGPGTGAITLPVLARAKTLTAIELDRRVIPILQEKSAALGDLTLIEQDVLEVDYATLLGEANWRVFGNLPYNISTPILFTLAAVPCIQDMVFMLQKEVVERMIALPGEKNYGRLSVMLAYQHELYPLFDVPPESFSPSPKVMSAMVGMTRLSQPRWAVQDEHVFAEVVKQAFAMRRKTLRNTLKPLIDGDTLAMLNIDPGVRAESLDGADFAHIANYLSNHTMKIKPLGKPS